MPQTILVTGATSFIAGHIIKLLLDKGYNVRGTVRSKAKESAVLETIPENQRQQVSFAHVVDISTDSFDEAVQGVDGIIHVASPFQLKMEDPEKDLLLPAIRGTESVLKAAHQYNTSQKDEKKKIKRIVITSSFASVYDPSKGLGPELTYSEKDWFNVSYEEAAAARNDPSKVYRASKKLAEEAAWTFLDKQKPAFTIATICEPMVFGPRADSLKSLDDLNTSNAQVWRLVTSGKDAAIPDARLPWAIDVRDVAFAHVAALENHVEKSQRYIIAGDTYSHQGIADLVHDSTRIPSTIKDQTPRGTPGQAAKEIFKIDSSKAQKELGIKYTPLKQTFEDLILQLANIQKQSQ